MLTGDGLSGKTQDSDRFFPYDAMNRQTVVDAVDPAGNLGTQNHRIAYDHEHHGAIAKSTLHHQAMRKQ